MSPASDHTPGSIPQNNECLSRPCADCTSFLYMLEQHCVGLGQNLEGHNFTGGRTLAQHKPNIRSLHASARHGCTMCGWLWICIREIYRKHHVSTYRDSEILEGIVNLSFVWQHQLSQDFAGRLGARYMFALWAMPCDATKSMSSPLPEERVVISRMLSEDATLCEAIADLKPITSSQATNILIRNWMDLCSSHHSACNDRSRGGMENVLPSRVLDITCVDNIHLIQTDSLTSEEFVPRYAALSHCWGQTNKPQLDTETEGELRRGYPLSSFPPTFKDAIELTRGLGLDFIWIDSLCIAQDSQEDWLVESAKLGGVYGNSSVCISATDAVDHDGGCFHDRGPLSDVAAGSDASYSRFNKPFTYGNLVVSAELGLNLMYHHQRNIEHAPVNVRAWVLQERMLAPRIVHCAREQIVWECCEGWSWESHPVAITKVRNRLYSNPFSNFMSVKQCYMEIGHIRASDGDGSYLPGSKIVRALQQWSKLIEAYTTKRTTFMSDKLIACSAVTRVTAPLLGRVVAGLWQEHLASQLLWYRKYGSADRDEHMFQKTIGGLRPRQAPSWSWASHDFAVRLPNYKYSRISRESVFGYLIDQTSLVDILSVDVVLRGEDFNGAVVNGTIHMRGHMLPLFKHSDAKCPYHLQPADAGGQDYITTRWDDTLEDEISTLLLPDDDSRAPGSFSGLPSGGRAPLPWSATPRMSSQVAVPIMMTLGDVMRIVGLILESTGAAENEFRRCGLFHMSLEYYDRLKAPLQDVLSTQTSSMFSRAATERHACQQAQTFTIV